LRGPNLSFTGVGAGVGAATGAGVGIGNVVANGLGFGVAVLAGSAGGVAAGGTKLLVGAGVAEGAGTNVGAELGAGALALGVFAGPLTVVDDPAGTDTSTPPALVSTVPLIVTTVVSPVGVTVTDESEPARITDAIAAVRTS
jgi:hypothetical protein